MAVRTCIILSRFVLIGGVVFFLFSFFLAETYGASKDVSVTRLAYRVRLGNARQQRLAAWQIRAQRSVQAIPYLLGLSRMKEAARRRGAYLALARIPLRWSAPLLRQGLNDRDPEVQRAALEAVVWRKVPVSSATLLNWVQDGSFRRASLALQALTVLYAGHRETSRILQALKTMPATRQKRLELQLSLTLASLGAPAARKSWFRWLRTRKGRELLARWPGRWAAQQLVSRGLHRPSVRIRRLYARLLLLRPTAFRVRLLQQRCQQKKLQGRVCGSVRVWARRVLTPFPAMPRPFFLMTRKQVQARLAAIHREHKTRYARLQAVTRSMWGMPYKLDALGEGKQGRIDRDPTFSLKHLDCVTYLEESFALASKATLKQAVDYTQKLRYLGGVVSYKTRKHLPMAQWIPSLTRMGWLKDITQEVGGTAAQTMVKQINRRSYSTRTGQRFLRRLGRRNIVRGRFVLPYMRTTDAIPLAERIPAMTLLNVVRAPNLWSPAQIGHVGLIVRVGGRLYFRHASRVWQSVVDVPLRGYISRLSRYKRSGWGINLLRVLPAGK